jgi:hypothetical protein
MNQNAMISDAIFPVMQPNFSVERMAAGRFALQTPARGVRHHLTSTLGGSERWGVTSTL